MKLKNLYLTLISLLVFCGLAYSQNSHFTYTATATGPSTGLNLTFGGINYNQITWTVSGTVSSCTVALDSSVDGVTWTSGGAITGQTCTSNGNSTVVSGTFNYVRINVTALGGTGATVNVVYDGWIVNPSGGGGLASYVYAQTSVQAGDTITSGSGYTNFATNYQFAANSLCSSGVHGYHIIDAGEFDITSAGNGVYIQLSLGSTAIVQEQVFDGGTGNGTWSLDAWVTCVSAGTSGIVEVHGIGREGRILNNAASTQMDLTNSTTASPLTINTTTTQTVQVAVNMSQFTGSAVQRGLIITKF